MVNSYLRLFDLRTFGRLEPAERRALISAVFLVGGIRVALWLLPVRRVRKILRACERIPLAVPPELPVSRLVWAVQAASRRIPMATCLTQSLALQSLLSRTGRSSELHLGVRKDQQSGFQAHAWVECAGATLLSSSTEVAGLRAFALAGGRFILNSLGLPLEHPDLSFDWSFLRLHSLWFPAAYQHQIDSGGIPVEGNADLELIPADTGVV